MPGTSQRPGLFGSSDVWITETPSDRAGELLRQQHDPPGWSLPEPGASHPATVELGNERRLAYSVRTSPATGATR
jgi:hypothetical protein